MACRKTGHFFLLNGVNANANCQKIALFCSKMRNMKKFGFALFFALLFISACKDKPASKADRAKPRPGRRGICQTHELCVSRPASPRHQCFHGRTIFHNRQLFEGTGSPAELPQTRSVTGPVDIKTGLIDVKIELDRNKFLAKKVLSF